MKIIEKIKNGIIFDEKVFILRMNAKLEIGCHPPCGLGDDTKKYIDYLERRVIELEDDIIMGNCHEV